MIRGLNQKITYWAPNTSNQFGGLSYGAPIILDGRWEDSMENVITPAGQEIVSRAKIYTDTPVRDTGYIYPGIPADLGVNPEAIDGAYEIRTVASIPDLRNLKRLWTAYI
jgi:hypothetical protein